ncbi:hypothetical protein fugu_006630 [Takifugu bimaculatus]|uniref:MICOS complex subunit MIC10 n=1 Tax=Takifugu bimaculatus TaxID=433685 RepID=A0A4Z2B664_9TELE|nr:hypothetical protein fugu_006630 [Takifugu bimaculatus]
MSEKELGKKWDRCLADAAIKLGSGLGLGIVFSVLFFKRKLPNNNVLDLAQEIDCRGYRHQGMT